jgi:hypothetical protein
LVHANSNIVLKTKILSLNLARCDLLKNYSLLISTVTHKRELNIRSIKVQKKITFLYQLKFLGKMIDE